jgi:hypothetical protein
MSKFGANDLDVIARRALLDALEVLEPHLNSLILVGAQALYMHTQHIYLTLAPATSDADIAIDTRLLGNSPELNQLLRPAGYFENPISDGQPGHWLNKDNIPLDLYQPAAISGRGATARAAHLDPHGKNLVRIGRGLDSVLVDNDIMEINSFDETDKRSFQIKVAGPAALLVAKLAKIADREQDFGARAAYKDALDVFRLLNAVPSAELALTLMALKSEDLCSAEAIRGISLLNKLFAADQNAPGNQMVAAATQNVEDPATIRARSWALALELVEALGN